MNTIDTKDKEYNQLKKKLFDSNMQLVLRSKDIKGKELLKLKKEIASIKTDIAKFMFLSKENEKEMLLEGRIEK